ncbi:TetR/AcrR family transcriptional regulator [Streptomyces fuscichromogenes]|uniref:TetR/AcrR family transcriptional regulator n=1 Tax=Streptomyces fuscichromogenes TaxID=1324013 RepID=UPI0037F86176
MTPQKPERSARPTPRAVAHSGTAKLGRPRASGAAKDEDPRQAILVAAAELFSRTGYARTSTRAIAEQVGLRQPSVFHYFKTKEDLLAELLENLITPTTQLLARLEVLDAAPAAKLYALAFGDVLNMASSDTNMTTLQFLNDARTERFDAFWALRTQLFDGYSKLISEGLANAVFACRKESIARSVVFGIADSVALWEDADSFEPYEISIEVADAILLFLLADKDDMETVRTEGLALIPSARKEAE